MSDVHVDEKVVFGCVVMTLFLFLCCGICVVIASRLYLLTEKKNALVVEKVWEGEGVWRFVHIFSTHVLSVFMMS